MELAAVLVVILVALAFDYTNGFHDAANAIAVAVSTKALTPRVALALAAVMNLVGALLSTGAEFDPEKVDVRFASAAGEVEVCRQGRGLDFDEALAKKILTEHDVEILIHMGEGDAACTCWGCDITYDYIKINGDYRT